MSPATARFKRLAVGIVVVALIIRLAAAVAMFNKPLTFDARSYSTAARSLDAGRGYPKAVGVPGPSALRPPGLPFFLAGVYELDDSQKAGRIAEAFVGAGIVALLGLVAYQLLGATAALIALSIAAIYPPTVIIGTSLLSEPLFIVCELAAMAAALASGKSGKGRFWWAAVAGAFSGLSWLTRDTGPAVVIAAALVAWTGKSELSRRGLALPFVVIACAVATIAPWTIRNAVVMHAFIPVSDESGYTLAGTYNATSQDSSTYPSVWIPAQDAVVNARIMQRATGEVQEDRALTHAAESYIISHPQSVLKTGAYNTLRLLSLDGILGIDTKMQSPVNYEGEEYVGGVVADLGVIGFFAVLILAILGVFTTTARSIPWAVWSLPVLLATTVFIESGNRFRLVIDPFLIILAVCALDAMRRRLSLRRRGSHAHGGGSFLPTSS